MQAVYIHRQALITGLLVQLTLARTYEYMGKQCKEVDSRTLCKKGVRCSIYPPQRMDICLPFIRERCRNELGITLQAQEAHDKQSMGKG